MRDRAEEVRQLMKEMYGATKFDLAREFPEQICLLEDDQCRIYQVKQELKRPDGVVEYDVWGLACFSEEFIGNLFIQALDRKDLKPATMTFSAARELAQTKTVSCLFLLDNPKNIIVHWVK